MTAKECLVPDKNSSLAKGIKLNVQHRLLLLIIIILLLLLIIIIATKVITTKWKEWNKIGVIIIIRTYENKIPWVFVI